MYRTLGAATIAAVMMMAGNASAEGSAKEGSAKDGSAKEGSAKVDGAGATFPSNVYAKWGGQYANESGVAISYKPTGSGDGVKQITEHAVQFGGSDSPLSAEELDKRHLMQLPMVIGGIVPVVNLPGIADAALQLEGPVLADILTGRIERWDDPRIVELNKGVRLPNLPIRRIVRAEKSGTTEGFTKYLSMVSPAFAQEVGSSQLPHWPGTVLRAEGNDGMAKAIKTNPGAIAYVSYDRVTHDGLASVRLRNLHGVYVKASEVGFRSAIVQSELGRTGNDLATLMNRPGPDSWPITSATFVLVDATPQHAEAASPVLTFLYWCFLHGDELTKGTGFAPLPTSVQSRLAVRFASVKAQDGKQIPYVKF
jgi:phosphate transport system substrate-binding protein